jgi:RNase P subunit RPR2
MEEDLFSTQHTHQVPLSSLSASCLSFLDSGDQPDDGCLAINWEIYLSLMSLMSPFTYNTQPAWLPPPAESPVSYISTQYLTSEEPPKIKQCPLCNLTFASAKGMKQHYGKMHIHSEKQDFCSLCSKGFNNKYALRYHIKQVHEKTTRVTCELCGRQLYNKYVMKRHLKISHTR